MPSQNDDEEYDDDSGQDSGDDDIVVWGDPDAFYWLDLELYDYSHDGVLGDEDMDMFIRQLLPDDGYIITHTIDRSGTIELVYQDMETQELVGAIEMNVFTGEGNLVIF